MFVRPQIVELLNHYMPLLKPMFPYDSSTIRTITRLPLLIMETQIVMFDAPLCPVHPPCPQDNITSSIGGNEI